MTEEGFFLFIGGKRIARKLTSLEEKFPDHLMTITRHGAEGDTNAKYDVVASKDAAMVNKLLAVKGHAFSQEALDEAILEASEVMDR